MKKFFVPLFLILIFGCSNEKIEIDPNAASTQRDIHCYVKDSDDYYEKISENLCLEIIGGTEGYRPPVDVSSSSDEESSSSRGSVSRSSSSGGAISSSSGGAGSSSSHIGSSSSGTGSSSSHLGSSSSGGADSSSSVVAGSSSSVVAGSSSSVVAISSSSGGAGSSSSSVAVSSSSSSLAPPSLGDCSAFPSYVSKAKEESLKDLVSLENHYDRCGEVTYSTNSNFAVITGNSISFANAPSAPGTRTLNITARVTCTGFTVSSKPCQIPIEVIGDKFAKIEICDDPRVSVGPGTTVVEVSCTNKEGLPARNFGCNKREGDGSFGPNDVFTLNGSKAGNGQTSGNWQSTWAFIAIPPTLAAKESKRVLIDYTKEIGCVAYY
jgi:hypothetical protein